MAKGTFRISEGFVNQKMDNHEHKSEPNDVNVGVISKKSFPGKNSESRNSLEDTNCNLTILPSKDIDLSGLDIQSCGENLNELSLNGPVKLLNGIQNIHSEDSNCCSSNTNLGNTSHFEKIIGSAESPEEFTVATAIDNGGLEAAQCQPHDCISSETSCHTLTSTSENCSVETLCNVKTEDLAEDKTISKEPPTAVGCTSSEESRDQEGEVTYVSYESELQMPDIMRLIQKDLSEPYSIYTYRYFIHNWPQLCFLAMDKTTCVGAIVCKLDMHRKVVKRGYIAMLAVDEKYRKRKIGSNLVLKAIRAMVADGADEVVLETEITNKPALRLYENLGFVRDKRLFRYYLNGVDALRLKLWLR